MSRSPTQTQELIETAHELADAARRAILPYFRSGALGTQNKEEGGYDPVTLADRASEQAMRDILARRRPDDGILGEEFGTQAGTSGLTWVLDPIDGTRAFVAGTPTWAVLIGLVDATGPILGLMDQPYTTERWIGGLGQAVFEGPQGTKPLRVRSTTDPAQAILMTTFPEVGTPAEGNAFRRLSQDVQLVRYGLDCYAYGLVALGQIDLVVEAGLASYDICSHVAMIEAAGGVVTNWEGGPVHEGGRAIAAATPELHAHAMAVLRGSGA